MKRKDAHDFLKKGYPKKAEEYITEAEHQEGSEEFWEFFDNEAQLEEDFKLFLKNR